jgi:hypothetical protein
MLRISLIGLILLILSSAWLPSGAYFQSIAQVDPHKQDRATIMEVLKNQQNSWNKADVESFLEGYWHSHELTFSGSDGIARGWDAVRARYQKSYADREAMGHLEFSELEFDFSGPMPLLFWATGI